MTHRTTSSALTAVVAVFALAASACNGDPSSADPPTTEASIADSEPTTSSASPSTTTPTTDNTTTTSAPPTTTEPPTTAVPTTPATIAPDDWPAILTELSRRQVSLYASPDLSRIPEYCMPDTDCAAQLEAQLSDAIARGEHVEGQQPFTIVDIVDVSIGEPSPLGQLADVLLIVGPTASPPARIVDANGNVVDELTGSTTNTRGRFTLAAWNDPILPWRVVTAESLGPDA